MNSVLLKIAIVALLIAFAIVCYYPILHLNGNYCLVFSLFILVKKLVLSLKYTMAELNHKKNVHGGHRASATKMVKKAEELLAQEVPNKSLLARMKLSLQEKLSTLKELDSEVVDLVKEEEVVNEIEQADAYKEDIYDAIAKLEQLSLKTSTTAPAATVLPSRDPASESKVRLPKLMIQPFRGELTTWTTFWDSS